MITITGYIVIFIFILFIIDVIKKGPHLTDTNAEHYVKIKDNKFNRNNIFINLGDKLDIENKDQYRHAFTIDEPTLKNSEILYQYDNYILIFRKPGIYKIESSLYDNITPLKIYVDVPESGISFYSKFNNNISNSKKIISEYINKLL